MNAAQFSNLMGMDRLTSDIKRAGFQTSPDPVGDTSVCLAPASPLDELLTAVRVYEGATDATFASAAGFAATYGSGYPANNLALAENNRLPDRIRLAGNYATSERFKIGLVDQTGGRIGVEVDQLAVQRIFADRGSNGGFCSFFPVNGVVRIQDQAGLTRFAPITACNETVGTVNYTQLIVDVDPAAFVGGSCSEPSGGYLNPVSMVDYFLVQGADLGTYGFPAGVSAVGAEDSALNNITGESSRMMLVRRQVDTTGATVSVPEVVADYVVDLNFRGRYATEVPGGTPPITLTDEPFESIDNVSPNRLRTLGVRLTTRARNPDRADAPAAIPTSDLALTRFRVFDSSNAGYTTNKYQYARVRTLYADVTMPNMTNHTPW